MMGRMKLTRDQAEAHLLLNGWVMYEYATAFTHDPGWYIRHTEHGQFRTATGVRIVREKSLIPLLNQSEALMSAPPPNIFWALFDRAYGLGCIPEIVGYRWKTTIDNDEPLELPEDGRWIDP